MTLKNASSTAIYSNTFHLVCVQIYFSNEQISVLAINKMIKMSFPLIIKYNIAIVTTTHKDRLKCDLELPVLMKHSIIII